MFAASSLRGVPLPHASADPRAELAATHPQHPSNTNETANVVRRRICFIRVGPRVALLSPRRSCRGGFAGGVVPKPRTPEQPQPATGESPAPTCWSTSLPECNYRLAVDRTPFGPVAAIAESNVFRYFLRLPKSIGQISPMDRQLSPSRPHCIDLGPPIPG